MRKNLLFLCTFLCVLGFFAACSDDKNDPEPPTVEQIVGEYAADKLNVKVNGQDASGSAKVSLVKESDNSISVKLLNIVSGIQEFIVPNVQFAAITRSEYVSTLQGSTIDNITGYNVKIDGHVENEILIATVSVEEITGEPIEVKQFYNTTFKGEMAISLGGEPVTMAQRVYVSTPKDKDPCSMRLRIENFAFAGVSLGNIQLDTVRVEKRGDVYGFTAKNREMEVPGIGKVSLDARGAIVDEHIMKLNLMVNASPLIVYVTFEGDTVKESTDTKVKLTVDADCVVDQPDNSKTSSIFIFKVWNSTPASELMLTPKIELPEKATLDSIVVRYSDGTKVILKENDAIDFSKIEGTKYDVKYHITPEDVRYPSTKTLRLERLYDVNPVFNMINWVTPSEKEFEEPENMATSNTAADFFPLSGQMIGEELLAKPYPVSKDGDAAKIITRDTKGGDAWLAILPKVTAGTLFNGVFELQASAPLKSTQFGQPYRKKPAKLKVTYKYTPGPVFYETIITGDEFPRKVEGKVIDGKTDECSIIAYLYEVDSYDDYLDGTNINKPESRVILKAALSDGTAKASFVDQIITFEKTGKGDYNPAKKYKLAIVCTPSKEGDAYKGAPESTLWVKYLEVVSE